ncbi:MAG TPA: hypothetical protein PKA10_09520 [Selenomonadales bacterium]|nr:hypothetical protein [Selenomonadales bacterium]
MKLWKWFCKIGNSGKVSRRPAFLPSEGKRDPDGAATMCTRVCGSNGCRCGGTMRGLYCVWSYYRAPGADEEASPEPGGPRVGGNGEK